jgi:GDPmannose 4,6-dehydratase
VVGFYKRLARNQIDHGSFVLENYMNKRALITGVTGQDGAYLAQLLLRKGYQVIGAVRRTSMSNLARLEELGIAGNVELVDFDLLELSNIYRTIERTRPDEIYNLAAQSFVGASFELPIYTGDCDALGVVRVLDAVRTINPKIRFYQASTSEMFGNAPETPQAETTPFRPRSPYGIAKLYAHWITVNYRESYGIHACSGILFNHESPLRGQEFVTRKITLSLARVKHGLAEMVELGNLDARRDWGFAGDYVEGMWRMLQRDQADDYVLATCKSHSVREFLQLAGRGLGMELDLEGQGPEERAVDRKTGRTVARVNPKFYRPAEVDALVGNCAKATRQLGWETRVSFAELVGMMAESDERRVRDNAVRF